MGAALLIMALVVPSPAPTPVLVPAFALTHLTSLFVCAWLIESASAIDIDTEALANAASFHLRSQLAFLTNLYIIVTR